MRLPRDVARAARLLARYCPVGRPVSLTLVSKWSGEWGQTWAHRGTRYVEAYRCRGEWADITIHSLIHEWAHAMTWDRTRVDHGTVWGKAHSRCYRVVLEGWRPKR